MAGAEYAADWPAWGHRKIAAMMRADGHQVSTSTVQRALRRRGLLLPTGFRADRRSWARLRKRVFRDPPRQRNRVWRAAVEAERVLDLDDLRADRGVMDVVDADDYVIVVEWFFGTLKYEHLYRATIGDGNALAVEVNLFRHTDNTCDPTRPSTNAHHARLTSPSNTAISVWPLADPLLDWEVLT